jgi:YggT family protein
MTPTDTFFTHWYFHVPNLIMAAMLYTLVGRFLLELFFTNNQGAVILKVFRTLTDPILRAVRVVTPAVVPGGLVIVFAVFWLMGLRMFLYLTMLASGAMKLG